MQRREFVRQASAILLLLQSGEWRRLSSLPEDDSRQRLLRFSIASDGHYGQPNTDYHRFLTDLVSRVNEEHRQKPFDFCVINGDLVHDDKRFYPELKKGLDQLLPRYYVSQGNHDHVNAEEWEQIWKMPVNLDFRIHRHSVLIGTTSDEKGSYLCPDLTWFSRKLEEHRSQRNIFVFIHINPVKQTANAVDCPAFFDLLGKYPNVRAVFNGHDHDQDDIKMKGAVPFIFDAHYGGSWGTAYRGFRVVELHKDNSLLTYILNPTERIGEQKIPL